MRVTYHEAKFTEMVLFVAGRLRDDRVGGASKLARVLYFSDFAHVRRHGRPITGAPYVRAGAGPTPSELRAVRDRLVAEGLAEIVIEDFLGYETRRLVAVGEIACTVLSDPELVTINGVLDNLAGLTGKQIDDLTQGEPGWRCTADGDVIPYEAALIARRQIVTPTGRRLAEEAAARYGIIVPA